MLSILESGNTIEELSLLSEINVTVSVVNKKFIRRNLIFSKRKVISIFTCFTTDLYTAYCKLSCLIILRLFSIQIVKFKYSYSHSELHRDRCNVIYWRRHEKSFIYTEVQNSFYRSTSNETSSASRSCGLSTSRGTHSFRPMRAEYVKNILGFTTPCHWMHWSIPRLHTPTCQGFNRACSTHNKQV